MIFLSKEAEEIFKNAKNFFSEPPPPICLQCKRISGYDRQDYAGKETEWTLLLKLMPINYFTIDPHIYIALNCCHSCDGFYDGLDNRPLSKLVDFPAREQIEYEISWNRGRVIYEQKITNEQAEAKKILGSKRSRT